MSRFCYAMEELYSLVQCLTSREWESLQQYLTCFSTHGTDPFGPKQLQLARLLKEEETCPAEPRCSLLIYGVKDEPCFQMLKWRLKEKVLDFLLTDISCDKKKELDEADYAIIRIKKKSAQFQQLYYSKKRNLLFYNLLDEIIFLARKYEQYSSLVEHLRIKKGIVNWKEGKREFEKMNAEMRKYWECNRMVNEAEHYYYELILLSEYSGNPDAQKLNSFFKKATAELEGYYEHTKSPLIKYHHKFLELGFYQHRKNYSKARSVCLELLDVVRNNKSVYRRQRVGVVYDNLSRCEVYLGDFDEAAAWSREAQKYFNAGSENYCIALEQEFYALFAMEQYDGAVVHAQKMISSATRKELGEFREAKYQYLLANALFKQQRFREALNLLSTERELSKDKAGWETGARTLKIMTLVEMNLLDEASLAISNLKRFFSRTAHISPRDKKILNLLLLAERKGFMFSLLHGSADKYMEKLGGRSWELTDHHELKTPDSELSWEPFTHEIIPFHEWFAEKRKKKIPTHKSQAAREERKKVVSL